MRWSILAFCLGVLAVQCLRELPGLPLVAGLLCIGLPAVRYRCWPLLALLLGLGWAVWRAHCALEARLPPALEDLPLQIEGRVLGLPEAAPRLTRFAFKPSQLSLDGHPLAFRPRQLLLVSYDAGFSPPAGGECQLYVRLKQVRGTRNPGSFDSETWLFANGVDGRGQVIAHPANRCVSPIGWGRIDSFRATISAAIAAAVPAPDVAGILAALAVGQRANMSDHQWQVLRDTGTTHMISISGLHISMVALALYVLGRQLIAFSPALSRRFPAPRAALVLGFAGSLLYSVLTGFPVPTQRSVAMLAFMFYRRWRGYALLDSDGLLLAFALVLLCDPLSSLTVSFWLTFGAVLTLSIVGHIHQRMGKPQQWAMMHLWLALMLAPLLLLVAPGVAWISPLANALAVPLVTWAVVPLVLLGIAFAVLAPPFAASCWQWAGALWGGVWQGLEWLAAHAAALPLEFVPDALTVLLASCGLLLFLLPFGRGRYGLAALLVAGLAFHSPARPAVGALKATVLDVGQGLAVVLETHTHVMLFDTGPSTFGGADAGADIVLPFLRLRGQRRLDRVMVSHADNDHAGGLGALQRGLQIDTLSLSPLQAWPSTVERCAAGQRWRWDDVEFEVLHPAPGAADGLENNASCVLRVSAGGHHVLLTGDIEAPAEAALVAQDAALAAEVLLVPHHGSATSSSAPFLDKVAPRTAVLSVGYRNRFGLPSAAVMARYAARGVPVLDTRHTGAITLDVDDSGIQFTQFRAQTARYWHAQ
jgi:competence protein ComEC